MVTHSPNSAPATRNLAPAGPNYGPNYLSLATPVAIPVPPQPPKSWQVAPLAEVPGEVEEAARLAAQVDDEDSEGAYGDSLDIRDQLRHGQEVLFREVVRIKVALEAYAADPACQVPIDLGWIDQMVQGVTLGAVEELGRRRVEHTEAMAAWEVEIGKVVVRKDEETAVWHRPVLVQDHRFEFDDERRLVLAPAGTVYCGQSYDETWVSGSRDEAVVRAMGCRKCAETLKEPNQHGMRVKRWAAMRTKGKRRGT